MKRTMLVLLVALMGALLLLTANGRAQEGADIFLPFMSRAGTREQLDNGEVVSSPEGAAVGAPDGALEEPLQVTIAQTELPEDAPALPPEAGAAGAAFLFSADRPAYTPALSPFIAGLPVPDGADPAHLAVAVLDPAEETMAQIDPVPGGEVSPDTGISDMWAILPGQYDAEHNLFLTTLPYLTPEGRLLLLVQSDEYNATQQREPQGARQAAAPTIEFEADCRGFAALNRGSECGQTEENQIANAIEAAFNDFTALSYPLPYLQAEVDFSMYPPSIDDTTIRFQAELRPEVSVSVPDDQLGLCQNNGNIVNRGRYSDSSKTLTVCLNSSGVTNRVLDTATHEYVHATQWGFSAVRQDSWEGWLIEGTAAASENSRATMARDTGRPLHTVGNSLLEDRGLTEYRAQDYWVYLGLELNQGFDYLIPIFEQGASVSAVATALQNDFSPAVDLGDSYWAWAKNQAFEKQIDLGGNVLGAPCVLNTAVTSPQPVTYNPVNTPADSTFHLNPLDATVIRYSFPSFADADYETDVWVNGTGANYKVKFYDAGSTGSGCWSEPDSSGENLFVNQGDSATHYALVANLDQTQAISVTTGFDPVPQVTVNQPASATFRDGESLTFAATATGFDSYDLTDIRWSYDQDGVPFTFATSDSGEVFTHTLPCNDGASYLIQAEAFDARTSASASDYFSVSCVPPTDDALFYSDSPLNGYIASDDVVSADVDPLLVGDNADNDYIYALITFNIGSLPDSIQSIESASLTLDIQNVLGDPYSELGDLRVYHVDYGETLEAADMIPTFLPGAGTFAVETGIQTVDMTTAVQNAWENRDARNGRVQFLLRFSPVAGNDDNAADQVEISNAGSFNLLSPTLEMVYRNY